MNAAQNLLKDSKLRNAYSVKLRQYNLRDGQQIDPDFAAKIARGENPADTFVNEGRIEPIPAPTAFQQPTAAQKVEPKKAETQKVNAPAAKKVAPKKKSGNV